MTNAECPQRDGHASLAGPRLHGGLRPRDVPAGAVRKRGHARLHASRAHVPADDPPRLGRPDALDGRALPVRAHVPAPAAGHLRPLRRHAGRCAGRTSTRAASRTRCAPSRASAASSGSSSPGARRDGRAAGRAEYTPEHEPRRAARGAPAGDARSRLRARIGRAPRGGAGPAGHAPRTEFKARRVVDDRDLYRQALADRGAAHDERRCRSRARVHASGRAVSW